LVQLGKRHSTSLQTGGWHLYHSPINTMDCMDILTKMGCRGDSPTSTNYRISHLLHFSHFCPVVTLVHFLMYDRLGMCHYWPNGRYAACYMGYSHPIGWKNVFYCNFRMDTKGELFPFVMLINSSSLPWNSSLRPYAEE
jgi:hypothetical protein